MNDLYKIENPSVLTWAELMNKKEEITQWLGNYNIGNFNIHDDLTVDVDGSVYLDQYGLTEIPIQFGTVTGNFDIHSNKLKSLKGCPHTVGKSFNCSVNSLESLEYSPTTVGEDYDCKENQLVTLSGCPNVIHGIFRCGFNKLTDLSNGPLKVSFYRCEGNDIKSLKDFNCEVLEEFYHSTVLTEFYHTGEVFTTISSKITEYEDYYNDSDQLILKGKDLTAIQSYENLSKTVPNKNLTIEKKNKI